MWLFSPKLHSGGSWAFVPGRTESFSRSAPMREFPHRKWWSKKLSGLFEATVLSHNESLASSTAMGLRSTP
ncbi:MAG TPA: hypothetical protein P5176_07515 [Methanothrix sp.]|nr:hypothetical protein [Methanothrix sp.]